MSCVRTSPAGVGARRRAVRSVWLGSVSLLALLFAGDKGEARNLNSLGAVAPTAAAVQAAVAAAQQGASAAAQAQASLARAAAALAAARQAQQSAAALAARPTLANGQAIPSGIAQGGLMPTGGVTDANCATSCTLQLNTPESFTGADSKLTQTVKAGLTSVTVTQTQQQAIYNWDSFNISPSTSLNFTQQASNWVALNRVNPDASPALFLQNATSNNGHNNPSYIGGQITAPGAVYVINRNGIIFGAGAQVNVQSLVASTLDVGKLTDDQRARDQFFLTGGIGSPSPSSFSLFDSKGGATSPIIPGNVTVEAGASIATYIPTDVVPLGSPGFIYLFGANVYNFGTLTAPQGQVAMAASRAIALTPGSDEAANFPSNVLPSGVTFRGTGLQLQNYGRVFTTDNSGNLIDNAYLRDDVNHLITGEVTNGGVINTRQGVVTLAGDRVAVTNLQDAGGNVVRDAAGNLIPGVISADTSITRNSMVLMHAATSVKMDGVISVQPYDDGNTLPILSGAASSGTASTVQSYMPPYVEMAAQRSVTLGGSGLVSAPSGSVSLNAVALGGFTTSRQLFNGNGGDKRSLQPSLDGSQQVLLSGSDETGPGALIDVSGLQDVVLPASYNFISVTPRAEFADMPLQRNGALYGQTLWIDIRASGTRSDGTTWVGTPLADVSGEVGQVGRSINQLMTSGGNVSLTTDVGNTGISASSRQVIAESGSVINVAGGKITFLPGMVSITKLIGADGRMYSMANADTNMEYLGIAGQFTVDHARWGVKETWSIGTQAYEPGYTEGHDAGGITVTTASPQLNLGGQMYFGSIAGERQTAKGIAPSDTTGLTNGTASTPLQAKGDELPSQGYLSITTPSAVQIGSTGSSMFSVQDPVTQLSADTLSGYGLSALAIKAYDLVVSAGSTLRLAPGGVFSASIGGAIDVTGTISAQSGTINLSTNRYDLKILGANAPVLQAPTDPVTGAVIAANVYVEGSLDVSGRFVNATGQFGADAPGPAFIDGGVISIATSKDSLTTSPTVTRDLSGSILLAPGSTLDASSGGYISPLGKPKFASTDVLAGKGGKISFALYNGKDWIRSTGESGGPLVPTGDASQAILELDGTVLAYGFESNGSLRLGAADTLRIGGTLQTGETSIIKVGQGSALPAEWLTSGRFGSYTLEAISDGYSAADGANITVSAGVNLNLQQGNFSSALDYSATPTGTKLGAEALAAPATRLAQLPVDQRKPVNLSLKADTILLDSGSSITTDPKATIILGGSPAVGSALNDPLRNRAASSVRLRGSIVDHGGTVFINSANTWLDSWNSQQQARIDLSGILLPNSLFGQSNGPTASATVIPGGTFSIEAASLQTVIGGGSAYGAPGGSAVAENGLQVDVSGYAGAVQLSTQHGPSSSTWLWSDAGSVSVDVGGVAWSGDFAAVGGRLPDGTAMRGADGKTTVANNGTLIVGGGQMSLQQDNTAIIKALADYHQSNNTAGPTSIFVSADQLAPFDNVFLYSGTAIGGAARIFTDLPGNTANLGAPSLRSLTIADSLAWHVANRLHIAASSVTTGRDGSGVALDAPYVLLTGGGDPVQRGSSTITVSAETLDVEGAAFSGFKQVQLAATGDIRLSTPKVANDLSNVAGLASRFSGALATNGDLLLSAQRIYPVSAVDFSIKSTAGNVTFRAPAQSNTDVPLSAGGSLTVSAANIDQGGNLFAPLGKIKLAGGVGTNPDGTNQGVILEPGSLTSVTLADTVVPYGATSDGTGWYYNANLSPLSAPPAKGMEFDGASIAVNAGSVIDVRGGGDLQAMEWIQGKGGSHDTLTSINGGLGTGSGAGPIVYALLPTRNDAVAAFDVHFTAATSLNDPGQSGTKFKLPSGQTLYLQSGDAYPLPGSQITIDGGAGIPAGSYTLYPAHDATLPGALRVVYYGDNLVRKLPSGTTLPDGTVLVTGTYTQSTQPGKQSSGQGLFAVQTGAVWQQYSEYTFSTANAYFTQKATHDHTNVPRLPIDAGRLAVNAQQQIMLAGTALSEPATGGRGGELDIAGDKLAVVSHQQYLDSANPDNVPAGYIPLDASQLASFAFESMMIGGIRSDVDPTKGTQINPVATSVLVDTRGEKLTTPEILLVTQATGQWRDQYQWFKVGSTLVYVPMALYGPSADDGAVVIKAGSIIETTGAVHEGLGRNYYFANGTPTPTPLSRALEVAQSLGGTLQADGTITGVDLTSLHAYWYWNNYQSWTSTAGRDPTSMDYYAFGGPTTKQPGLGAFFVASNDPTLTLSGPTGVPATPLTLKFANVTPGAVPNVPDSGPVTALDGSPAQIVLPGSDAGRVTIESGATISTNALTLQGTAATKAIAINGDLHAQQLNLGAQTFAIGPGASSAINSSVQLSSSQLAEAQRLTLKSLSGAISVYGNFDPGPAMTSLTLDTAALLRAGNGDGKITVQNGSITLVNSRGLSLPAGLPSGTGNFAFEATDIVLGGGLQTIAGSAAVTMKATEQVLIAGPGNLTLGTGTDQVNLAVTTPTVLVAGASAAGSGAFTLATQGDVSLADVVARSDMAQRPTDNAAIGRNLAVVARKITVGNTIQAQAGTVTLEATGADLLNPDGSITQALRLTDGAYIAAGGYTKTLVDTTTYVAGGRVLLQADPANAGSILTSAKSVIDVAQPADGLGYGGQIQISATAGRAVVLGDLRGRGGNGLGGSFKVDANSLQVDGNGFDPDVKLDMLANKLLAGGLSGAIDIHTRTGNLTLSEGYTLKGSSVTLTADDPTWDSTNSARQFGQVTINGTIDASGYAGTTADGTGQAGGQVGLYGANQVTLAGTSFIDASTAHADERGGDVVVGIPWAAQGMIQLQPGMRIDVLGGTKGGLSNGTVTFRAPNDGNGDAKISSFDGVYIRNARSITVESLVAFDTKSSGYGLDASSLGWDGVVDPAGLYDASGNKVTTGSWTGISGFELKVISGGSGYQSAPPVLLNFADNTSAVAVMGLDGVTPLTLTVPKTSQPLLLAPNQPNLTVTFDAPTNTAANVTNRAAQGTASTDANGVVSITITDPGSGYTGFSFGVHIATTSQGVVDATVAAGGLKVVSIAAVKNATTPFRFIFNPVIFPYNGQPTQYAFAMATPASSLTGKSTANGFQLDEQDAFASVIPTVGGQTNGAIYQLDSSKHADFFGGTLTEFSQGTWTYNNQNYGFQNLIHRLSTFATQTGPDGKQVIDAGVVHVRPGIELVNSDPNTNSGNISVKGSWNLAAGAAYNLQPNVQPDNTQNGSKYVQAYDSSAPAQQSYVTFDYRLVADYGNGAVVEPGALTLRSLNNIVIGASISDGFFQFRNYLDPAYVASLATYLSANGARGIDPLNQSTNQYYLNTYLQAPIAPYQSTANVVSPSAQDLAVADLFPNQLNVCVTTCGAANSIGAIPQNARIVTVTNPGSWAYRITAGADLGSGNPNAVKPLDTTIYNPNYTVYNVKDPGKTPSVVVTGQTSYTQYLYDGVGKATVNLPTMVRTGTGNINVTAAYDVFLNDPDSTSPTANAAAPGVIYAAGVNTARLTDPNYKLQPGATQVVATAASASDLFFEPQLLGYGQFNGELIYGPPTAAAFPYMGGDVQVAAQQDIVGYSPATSTTAKSSYQYYKPWLLADAELTPAQDVTTASSISLRGQGVFAPIGTLIASQTAWWLQYGSFQQGILSAGGNVTAKAGRDVVDLSVSLPTTARVSGGLSATSTPVAHVYDSGNMMVSAGRDVLGGSFYEGSGHASIVAGRSIGATTEKLAWTGLDRTPLAITQSPLSLDNVPLLAVDLGRIQLTAGGAISIAGVVNPAALHRQSGSSANIGPTPTSTAIYMDTNGPASGVGLLSVTGNVTIGIAPTAINSSTSSVYPASFEAAALGGDIKTTGMGGNGFTPIPGMILSGSEAGDFQLLAEGGIDLTFGASPTAQLKPYISAGPSLLDKAFDPFRPVAWYGSHSGDSSYAGAFSAPVLSHQNDSTIARIVAATGDIVGSGRSTIDTKTGIVTGLTRVEMNRPTEVYAGGNITDLNMIVQNIRASDVSSVVAGGNITYTGLNIAGGLQIAGPGFFVVQAGGDLGPFLPVGHDTAAEVVAQQGIASVGNTSSVPVGNTFLAPALAGGLTGIYNSALLGPSSNVSKRRNALLGTNGADIIALFGVAKGINYQAVVDAYIDPRNSANVDHNYFGEMQAFLVRVNAAAGSDPLATFTALPESLQHAFIDQVFFAELKAVGVSNLGKAGSSRGYKMIETMFPSSYGYTSNDGGSLVKTGDLNMLHATIQTRQGGDISIFGPGGNILVGSLATEGNTNLKLSDLGILTLGGGAINTFTDESVLVNSSRVLTTQGGDVLMWSSNGDLDAGRGSKTTLSQPPLEVFFDSNDYEYIDLGGFVTGAGIGTVQASRVARASSLYLLAPRGIVDFGTAGGRSSGNLVVVAPVVANIANIQVQGTSTGIPVVAAPNMAGLSTAGSSATAATKSSDTPTAGGGNQDRASVFLVEVVGYGGGDDPGSNPARDGDTGSGSGAAPAQPDASGHNGDDRKKVSSQP